MTSISNPLPNPVPAHLQLPLELQGDGTFAFWAQDTLDEVGQAVEVLCGTTVGQRTVVPTYGLPNIVFTQPSKTEILQAINTWEPRAIPTVTVDYPDNTTAQVSVQVSLQRGTTP